MFASTGGLVAQFGYGKGEARKLRPAIAFACLLFCSFSVLPAAAKTPGTKYCFGGWCHRVGTLSQTDTLVGWRGYLVASFYDDCRRDRLNPCGLTSSGAVFRPEMPDNAASPLFPDGTIIIAYNPTTGDASVLRITSAGPYSGERKLDVSRAGAQRLGFAAAGTARLVVSVLKSPTKEEATYSKRREYPAVPGPIGKFETFDLALDAATQKLDIEATGANFVPARVNSSPGEIKDALIEPPRPAVSPYFARELMMLRVPPRPLSRERAMQVKAAAAEPEQASEQATASVPDESASETVMLDKPRAKNRRTAKSRNRHVASRHRDDD